MGISLDFGGRCEEAERVRDRSILGRKMSTRCGEKGVGKYATFKRKKIAKGCIDCGDRIVRVRWPPRNIVNSCGWFFFFFFFRELEIIR